MRLPCVCEQQCRGMCEDGFVRQVLVHRDEVKLDVRKLNAQQRGWESVGKLKGVAGSNWTRWERQATLRTL